MKNIEMQHSLFLTYSLTTSAYYQAGLTKQLLLLRLNKLIPNINKF
ncbi:hypothetical protein GARC_0630 [Paraglaciecola arctica BSs20135]|uniref:Uncharacterized protein n=1 Tax=Paraglaciecola arctica BSs20135 TaxID=493475 RepID=K6Y106_9ALTE|nr:hypothetical protein GARC_0630 [Paraglaciecola arctica BSs20135]